MLASTYNPKVYPRQEKGREDFNVGDWEDTWADQFLGYYVLGYAARGVTFRHVIVPLLRRLES